MTGGAMTLTAYSGFCPNLTGVVLVLPSGNLYAWHMPATTGGKTPVFLTTDAARDFSRCIRQILKYLAALRCFVFALRLSFRVRARETLSRQTPLRETVIEVLSSKSTS
jgi:hypothetical protein